MSYMSYWAGKRLLMAPLLKSLPIINEKLNSKTTFCTRGSERVQLCCTVQKYVELLHLVNATTAAGTFLTEGK